MEREQENFERDQISESAVIPKEQVPETQYYDSQLRDSNRQSKCKKQIWKKQDYGAAILLSAAAWFYFRGWEWFTGTWLVWFTVLFAAAGFCLLRAQGEKMTAEGKLYFAFLAISASWFLVKYLPGLEEWVGQDIMPYMVLFLHCAGVYWLLTVSGARFRERLDESGVIDLARGFIVIPLCHFDSLFKILYSAVKTWKGGKSSRSMEKKQRFGQAAFGVFLSIPVLVIVLPMLSAADESFYQFASGAAEWCTGLLDRFFGLFEFGEILFNFMVFLGACYFCGLFFGSFYAKTPKILSEGTGKEGEAGTNYGGKQAENGLELPMPLLLSFGSVVCGVYALFFAVKFADIGTRMFAGPGTFVYSAYARQGFFELQFIALLNICLFYFMKCLAPGKSRKLNMILSLLSVETLGFIALAFFKMSLYISVYGFTFKRVFTSWFMAVLFVVFSRLLLCIWKKGNAIGPAVIFASVTFLMLAYSNMDFWISRANLMMNLIG